MRIGLYNPYLSSVVGGGERHFLTIAECLSLKHQVDVILNQLDLKLKTKLEKTFNLDLKKVNFIQGPFNSSHSAKDRLNFTKNYHIFYYMTDGSFFVSKAQKNIVHFQIPFKNSPKLFQRLKLKSWNIKTANSNFTKNWLQQKWKINIDYVHRGSVDTQNLKPAQKTNTIISVGRFISGQAGKHCKRQDFLVKTFKKMVDQGLKNWRLVLIGPIEKGKDNLAFAKKVAQLAKAYPITIKHNSNFQQLAEDYSKAKIYWHAAGYGQDETINPQAVEHLGLTTAEAQSAGAVPVVINKGGQPEVVAHALNGLLWNTQPELINRTLELINNQALWQKLSTKAIKNSVNFSKQKFCQLTNKIFSL
ncbi:glycosyltransferase family 4 protein [Patescibacteria group bacterium]